VTASAAKEDANRQGAIDDGSVGEVTPATAAGPASGHNKCIGAQKTSRAGVAVRAWPLSPRPSHQPAGRLVRGLQGACHAQQAIARLSSVSCLLARGLSCTPRVGACWCGGSRLQTTPVRLQAGRLAQCWQGHGDAPGLTQSPTQRHAGEQLLQCRGQTPILTRSRC
jgi:hypothetical protein